MKKAAIISFFIYGVLTHAAAQVSAVFQSAWQFRKTGDAKWYPAKVPGTIHTDLLAHKLIPDPFYGDNEKKLQWIENENWEYKTVFIPPAALFTKKNIELVFDGLDTYASVYLNGKLLLTADNMFRPWRVNVKSVLRKQTNELKIVFSSAVRHDDSLASLSAIRLAGENNRMYSRKAQYQYGWDWGPRLLTCGIWKPIRWEAWDERKDNNSHSKRWNVELVTKPDSAGQSFYFTVNGTPTFIRGANWIPCESFLPRAKKLGLYKKLLREAKEANINMLRVWGGGIYEDDEFYELCDQYRIMVWQDFMFAGAMYPGDDYFLKNVEEEVRYQVQRLRKHPCIVIWCGNNEIDEAWHNWGWQQQFHYSPADSAKLWSDYRTIFHQLIPGILQELDPQRPYWPSSPSLGWGRDQAYQRGDVHYWGVWWGKEPVEKYKEKTGRFNSEYGMQGFPDIKTIRQFAGPDETDTASAVMRAHQKHPFGYPNIKLYIENKFRTPKTFEDLVYVSQLMQADAIKTAITAHRRNMPHTMGTMFWQWNDCWPVVSWSAVDYYGRKKALAYRLKDLYKNVMVTADYRDRQIDLWVISDSAADFYAGFKVELFNIAGTFLREIGREEQRLIRRGSANHFLFSVSPDIQGFPSGRYMVRVSLHQQNRLLASDLLFLSPPRDMELPGASVRWQLRGPDQLELTTDKFAYGVCLTLPDGIEAGDNYFHLLPGEKKMVRLSAPVTEGLLRKKLKIKSLVDTY